MAQAPTTADTVLGFDDRAGGEVNVERTLPVLSGAETTEGGSNINNVGEEESAEPSKGRASVTKREKKTKKKKRKGAPPPTEYSLSSNVRVEITFDAEEGTKPGVFPVVHHDHDNNDNERSLVFDIRKFSGRLTIRRLEEEVGAGDACEVGIESDKPGARNGNGSKPSSSVDVDVEKPQEPSDDELSIDPKKRMAIREFEGFASSRVQSTLHEPFAGSNTGNRTSFASSIAPALRSPWPWMKKNWNDEEDSRGVARNESDQALDENDLPAAPPPTRLHELCARAMVELHELEEALNSEPAAAKTRDACGRLPLHILGANEVLIGESSGREVATAFGLTLMRANPAGITALDGSNGDGRMPFVKLIEEWVQWVYELHHKNSQQSSENSMASNLKKIVESHLSANVTLDGSNASLVHFSTHTFPSVGLYAEVEWCFSMLSHAMDGLGGKNGGLHAVYQRHNKRSDKKARADLVGHLARTIPTLLKTIFLLEDDGSDSRRRLLRTSIVRRLLLCPQSVGEWLTIMLRRKGIPSQRAIDYLHVVSKLSVNDFVGFRNIQSDDIQEYEEERDGLFGAIGSLPQTVLSLLVLRDREQERAVAAPVLWYVMKKALVRPFVVSVVMTDFVLHLVLLLAFRSGINAMSRLPVQDHVPRAVVFVTCGYYVVRKACEAVSILVASRRVFWGYISNLWVVADLASILLTILAVALHSRGGSDRNSLNTCVMGLLWIKVLGFMKVVNRSMATFILTVFQIIRDLKFFALVLIVVILMFGDMFHISIFSKDNGQYCPSNEGSLSGPASDFCSPDIAESYLRVYALLLGDFELDDYRQTEGMMALFIIFTVVGMIILLNMLIAVMTASYDESMARSLLVFGRARIAFVAQSNALEALLRPREQRSEDGRYSTCITKFCSSTARLLVISSLIGTSLFGLIFLMYSLVQVLQQKEPNPVLLAFLFITGSILTFAQFVNVTFLLDFWIRGSSLQPVQKVVGAVDGCTAFLTHRIASRVFGLETEEDAPDATQVDATEEEWLHRASSLQNEFERMLKTTKEELKHEIRIHGNRDATSGEGDDPNGRRARWVVR